MAESNLQVFPDRLPQVTSVFGVPVREDVCFTDAKGRDNKRVRRIAERSLERLQDILPRVLAPNETVFLISTAQGQALTLEAFFVGVVVANAMSRTCLVVTNRRLLRFRIRSRALAAWSWDDGVTSLLWGDVTEVKPGRGLWTNQFTVRTRSGGKETYSGVGRPFNSKLNMILPVLLPSSSGETSAAGGPVALCPKCLGALVPRNYQCQQCSQAFKDEKSLLRRTIVIPGGEYFYVGHSVLGILVGFGELGLLVASIGTFIAAFSGDAQGDWVIAGFAFLILLIHKLSGYFACRRLVRTYLPVK
ncbi:MAG: hypothetical protein ACLP1Y_06755 [Candidatus Acidiferrales bacterium]